MRKIVGFVLLALGAALLAVGIVTTAWAPGVVKKTPLDVDTTTYLDGTAARLGAEERPVRITSVTRTDSEASDDATAVFVAVQCVVFTDEGDVPDCGDTTEETDNVTGDEGDERVLSITIDKFATDRVSALAVDEEGYVPEDSRGDQHDGIVNKFPFDAEKKTYDYWDGLTAQSWPAEFVAEEDVEGLATYHYQVQIESDDAEVIEGETGGYTNTVDIWVEPKTGGIVQQSQQQTRSLDGTEVLSLSAQFTDEQVTTSVEEAEDNIARLELVTKTLPLVGFIGGIVLLLAGAAVVLLGRRGRGTASHADDGRREPVSV
jgi:hypothetical protein